VGGHHAPRRDLMGVVIGKPGLGVHAAGAEECLVRVHLREEGVGLRAVAGRVAGAHLAAGQQQLDLLPGRQLHGDGDRVGEHAPAEVRGQRPGDLERGRADVDDDRVLRLDQAGGQPRDGALAVVVPDAARGEGPLGGLHGQRAAVHALEQALVTQPAQVTADRLDRHAEHPGQVLGRHGARLANLGEDRVASLGWHHVDRLMTGIDRSCRTLVRGSMAGHPVRARRSVARDLAAVHVHDLAGDVGGGFQVQDHADDVADLADTAKRR
jgi:hypothetical protein